MNKVIAISGLNLQSREESKEIVISPDGPLKGVVVDLIRGRYPINESLKLKAEDLIKSLDDIFLEDMTCFKRKDKALGLVLASAKNSKDIGLSRLLLDEYLNRAKSFEVFPYYEKRCLALGILQGIAYTYLSKSFISRRGHCLVYHPKDLDQEGAFALLDLLNKLENMKLEHEEFELFEVEKTEQVDKELFRSLKSKNFLAREKVYKDDFTKLNRLYGEDLEIVKMSMTVRR